MPHPYIQDIIEANALAREAIKYADLGLTSHPIPIKHLRLETVTDASWANIRVEKDIHETDLRAKGSVDSSSRSSMSSTISSCFCSRRS